MQVRKRLPDNPDPPSVLALGNFDGVHLGHRRLLESGLHESERKHAPLSVLVFDPHPLKVLHPERGFKLLTTTEERLHIFEKIGVDTIYLLPFTRQMADTSPQKFVEMVLVKTGVIHVVVGFNYSFGAAGKGTSEDLHTLGQKYGFGVSVLQAQSVDGRIISSSAIRKALSQGDVESARKMLGRSPCLCGKVVEGEQRGRLLGYPTANILPPADLLTPKRGVYAVWAELGGRKVSGIMNIGMKPTFHTMYATTVEVHFLDFNKNLYGQEIHIQIEDRLREERKFNGIDELKAQLHKDARQAEHVLSERLKR
ncbi:bifunctional riboflavin kinase/FAD synthetase [Paradesulfitobacterium aromaticivorans]